MVLVDSRHTLVFLNFECVQYAVKMRISTHPQLQLYRDKKDPCHLVGRADNNNAAPVA